MHIDIKNILLFLYKSNCFIGSLGFERQLGISSSIEQWPVLRYAEIHVSMEKWRNRISISYIFFKSSNICSINYVCLSG